MPAYNTLIVLLGTGLLGTICGALGTYLVLRRRALISDAAAHAALPGLCLAFLVIGSREFSGLLLGAFVSAVLGAWLVTLIRNHTRVKEDAAIGLVLATLFGLGIVLSRVIQNTTSAGSKAGLDSFIFGKTAGMVAQDVYFILAIGVMVLIAILALYKEFTVLSFDTGFAKVQGWPVLKLDVAMMGLVCAATIIGLPAVGVVMMAALLIIPAAAARFWTDRLSVMIVVSSAFGCATGLVGTLASARWPNVPAGPVIILSGTAVFLISMLLAPRRGIVARVRRHLSLERRIAEQNLLRTLYELSEDSWPEAPVLRPADLMRERAWDEGEAEKLLEHADRRGWARHSQGGYALTREGWRRAAEVVKAHRLWEIFLIEEAQIAPSQVDRDAERIEHVLAPDMVERLENRLAEAGLIPPPLADVPPRHRAVAQYETENA